MSFKFGKLAPRHDDRTFMFAKYAAELADPPESFSNTNRVYRVLGTSDPVKVFPMDGNDRFGNCTMAARAHLQTVWAAFVGKKVIPSAKTVVRDYKKLTGGEDTGLVMLDVLNWMRKRGDILAFAKIDAKNHKHVKQAHEHFGGVYLGFNVPKDCQQQFEGRIPWTPGPLLGEGHAIDSLDYTPNTLNVLTWGNDQLATWDWWSETVDEAWAIIPKEAKKKGFAPGFDYKQLEADLAGVS